MSQTEIDDQFVADLQRFKGKIANQWSLCGLFEATGRASEKEHMVAQTIHAACVNFAEQGEPFSFRGNGVFSVQGGGLADNATAYRYLVSKGYFREGERSGRAVIFPTRKLLDLLAEYFAKPLAQR